MTKVLVLGNSHVAALKKAENAFNEIYPKIELNYFSVSEPFFNKGKTDETGVYTPHGTAEIRNKIIYGNSHGAVSFSDYDHVMAVGLRAPLHMLTEVLKDHDILGTADAGESPLISRRFLKELIKLQVQQAILRWSTILGESFTGAIYAAPLPSVSIKNSTKRLDRRARASLALHRHSQAAWLFDQWRSNLTDQMSCLPATLLWQPEDTIEGPFIGKETYAEPDHVHMNEEFGLSLLKDYVQEMRIS